MLIRVLRHRVPPESFRHQERVYSRQLCRTICCKMDLRSNNTERTAAFTGCSGLYIAGQERDADLNVLPGKERVPKRILFDPHGTPMVTESKARNASRALPGNQLLPGEQDDTDRRSDKYPHPNHSHVILLC